MCIGASSGASCLDLDRLLRPLLAKGRSIGWGRQLDQRVLRHLRRGVLQTKELPPAAKAAAQLTSGSRTDAHHPLNRLVPVLVDGELLRDQGYGEVVEGNSSLTYRSLRPMPGDSTNSKKQPICQLESTAAQLVSKKGWF